MLVVKNLPATVSDTRDTGLIPDVGGEWKPTPVFLPGKPHGQRNLVDCSPWGRKELGMTERRHFTSLHIEILTGSHLSKKWIGMN